MPSPYLNITIFDRTGIFREPAQASRFVVLAEALQDTAQSPERIRRAIGIFMAAKNPGRVRVVSYSVRRVTQIPIKSANSRQHIALASGIFAVAICFDDGREERFRA